MSSHGDHSSSTASMPLRRRPEPTSEQLIVELSRSHGIPEQPTGPAEFLNRIRREFPDWGILAGTDRTPWRAVLGKDREITAVDGITLRENLLAATQHDRRPR